MSFMNMSCRPSSLIASFIAVTLAVLSASIAHAETITLGGVGSMTPLLKKLGDDYKKNKPGLEIEIIDPPMGTAGSIRALAANKIDIGLLGRAVKPDEAAQSKAWLHTPMVLASAGGKSKGLSRSQVADIYAGRLKAWDDGKPIRLVLRGASETETVVLRSISPEIDLAVTEVLKRSDLPIAENELDALNILTKISGSFGTTTLGLLMTQGSRLEALALEGNKPSVANLESGAYPWFRHYHLAHRNTPSPTTSAFLAYLNSPAALAIARKHGYIPAR